MQTLKAAVTTALDLVQGGEDLSPDSRVSALAELWLIQVDGDDRLARSTRARYRTIVESFVLPGVGQLRLRELTVRAVDRFLIANKAAHGATTAKGTRSVLSGMVNLAMRHQAMTTNPTRDVSPISVPRTAARALTLEQLADLLGKIAGDRDAIAYDLVDLCKFMAGTGVRIGEACALRVQQVDLEGGVVEINATVTDFGLEERTKTDAGRRVIAVPKSVMDLLERRIADPKIRTDVVIFPSPLGRVRDTSNTAADLRRAFDRAGYNWVSSHTFRKTVATRLDAAGQSARQIADHLGHAQPSMTQNVYMGRRSANAEPAKILEG